MPRGLILSGLFNLFGKNNQKSEDDADSRIHTSEQVNVVLGK
tara:strand:- start:412 stop:537 length:126 start_codon:yes stop_codon:yes gene_type:complete